MRTFFLLFLFFPFSWLYGESIKEEALKIHAILLPKTAMMDYQISKRFVDRAINIAVVFDTPQQRNDIEALERFIAAKFPEGINHHAIHINYVTYDNIATSDRHTLYYLLPASEDKIKQVVRKANTEHALTFSYRISDLESGVMFSVKISNKVQPIINVDALKINDITMRPILIKTSELFFQNTSYLRLNFYAQPPLRIV